MNTYQNIKQQISVKEVAEYYGFDIKHNMMCCPFHDDHTPSMKVDKRYHCFGCKADGDVIDFVSNYFGIDSKNAAIKIAKDFNIICDDGFLSSQIKNKVFKKENKTSGAEYYNILFVYYFLLKSWIEKYKPSPDDETLNAYFQFAINQIEKVDYLCTLFSSSKEIVEISIKNYEKEVMQYAKFLYRLKSIIGENAKQNIK